MGKKTSYKNKWGWYGYGEPGKVGETAGERAGPEVWCGSGSGGHRPLAACPAVRPLHTPSRLRHPEKQHCGHFRGGFGRRAGVPMGGVAAGFPVHPPDFRQHPQWVLDPQHRVHLSEQASTPALELTQPTEAGWALGDSASCSAWGRLEGGFLVSGQHGFFLPARGLPWAWGPKITSCQGRRSLCLLCGKD